MVLRPGAQAGRFAGQWQDGPVADFRVRPARPEDAPAMAALFAAVAAERDGIASEPPIDVAERTVVFAGSAASTVVAEAGAGGQVIGMLHVEASRHGFGELGMLVDRAWRGRGVGSALLAAAADWARDRGLHKLCLEVFAHNAAAIAAYRRAGYAEEGRRVAQYRRVSGELWDTIVMGLLL
jgi:RimJ/RimL family protein N-acetyltransferase